MELACISSGMIQNHGIWTKAEMDYAALPASIDYHEDPLDHGPATANGMGMTT